jgi:hypothetical protein
MGLPAIIAGFGLITITEVCLFSSLLIAQRQYPRSLNILLVVGVTATKVLLTYSIGLLN